MESPCYTQKPPQGNHEDSETETDEEEQPKHPRKSAKATARFRKASAAVGKRARKMFPTSVEKELEEADKMVNAMLHIFKKGSSAQQAMMIPMMDSKLRHLLDSQVHFFDKLAEDYYQSSDLLERSRRRCAERVILLRENEHRVKAIYGDLQRLKVDYPHVAALWKELPKGAKLAHPRKPIAADNSPHLALGMSPLPQEFILSSSHSSTKLTVTPTAAAVVTPEKSVSPLSATALANVSAAAPVMPPNTVSG